MPKCPARSRSLARLLPDWRLVCSTLVVAVGTLACSGQGGLLPDAGLDGTGGDRRVSLLDGGGGGDGLTGGDLRGDGPPVAEDGIAPGDVASDNDVGGADTGSCSVPPSCTVAFSYPKAAEQRLDLHGDFNDWSHGVLMWPDGDRWRGTVPLEHGKTVLYKFVVDGATWLPDPENPERSQEGDDNSILQVSCPEVCGGSPGPDGGDAGDAAAPTVPEGFFDWRDGMMYFVLLDRFNDGDPGNNAPEPGVETPANFQGGDLAGLLAKINDGYFTNLGVNVLWLSSPLDTPAGKYRGTDGYDYAGYHGYWPGDLTRVEEHLGDAALLTEVVQAAHAKGLKVVIDYVMNHVHSSSPVYAQHPEWFWPLDFDGRHCLCGADCSWDSSPDKERCWFDPFLPDFNFTRDDARAFSVNNAIALAQQTGIDGFRLDAVKHIETSWLTDLRSRLKAELTAPGKPFYLVGETYTGEQGLINSYIDVPTKLDGQFDFPLRAELVRTILMRQGTFYDLEGFLAQNDRYYGTLSVMGTFLGNHDLPRMIHLAEDNPQFGQWDGGKDRAWNNRPEDPGYDRPYERLQVAFSVLFALPGLPLVYYGDEIGLAGGGDPDNRRFMKWSGVSERQEKLRTHIAKLTRIRRDNPALRLGKRQEVWMGNDVYAFRMSHGASQVIVALNRSDSEQTISLPPPALGGDYTDLLSGRAVSAATVVVPPRTSMLLR